MFKEGIMHRADFLLGALGNATAYFRNVPASNKTILGFPGELNEFWTEHAAEPCGVASQCPTAMPKI